MHKKNTFKREYPSINDLKNLFEVSFTIYNYLQQNFDFYIEDDHSAYFDYFGKSLNNLPVNALEELEIILLYLPFNYIDTFVECLNIKLKLNFIYSIDFENLKFNEEDIENVYFLLSRTYYQLLKKLIQKHDFNPKIFLSNDSFSDDCYYRYNEFLKKFKEDE